MANRLIVGNRNGEMGFWISKPGVDVFSASNSDLLLSHELRPLQIAQNGIVSIAPGQGAVSFPIPSLGYKPMIVYKIDPTNDGLTHACYLSYNSSYTVATISKVFNYTMSVTLVISYAVMAVQIG